ncbi:E3 ubiquitin-protein ligase TRIM35-like [Eucyclogobius newberryi]|uniref:E3 ubiquitin-protein ligase TRIM35-like n=1 Tax=Eucyclogobius newberryi TaxID=166745 RepID=UPI003B5AAF70
MAGRLSLSEVDLSCPICCDIFNNPVVLKCSHSFCESCLQQHWAQIRPRRDCPMCRSELLDDPVPSLTLRNLCESYIQDAEDVEERTGGLQCDPGEMCPYHGEKFKLFCLVDKVPICVVCHTSRKHKQHDCCPLSEAIVEVKDKMKSALESLQEKRMTFEHMKKVYEDSESHIQFQAQQVERKTHKEFDVLRRFLEAEEAARVESLRREEEHKTLAMREKAEEMSRNIQTVSESIRALEEQMALDGVSVLHKCQQTLNRAVIPCEDSFMAPGALIDVATYLGSLKYHVWKKMNEIIEYTPVTLDPNTAAPWLVLSDDLSSVHDSEDKQNLPDNPERFDPDTGVLGSKGFTSGKHMWEVSVGSNTAWVVGVAKESVQRKDKVSSVLKNGYLSVYFYHKMYFAGTSPLTRLNLKRNLVRIRVLLDCDKGRVSFYDSYDNTHIYTFKHAIIERVFPYFWVGCQQCPLKIEPLDVSVKVQELMPF